MTLGGGHAPPSPIFSFEEYLTGGEEFKLRPFQKENGKLAFRIESEDGESAVFEVYRTIVLPLE